MKPKILLSILTAALGFGVSPIHAVNVLDDQFNDLDRTDGVAPLDSQWYVISSRATNFTVSAASGALVLSLGTSPGNANPHAVTTFAGQTLATGDTISFSFNFSSTGAINMTGLRFGIYNSGGTNLSGDVIADTATPATGTIFQNDLGYSVFAPLLGTDNTTPITFFSRPSNTTNNTLQLAAAANTSIDATHNLVTGTISGTTYSASLGLTRTVGGYDYAVSYAGTSYTGSTAIVNTSTFDTLSIFGVNGQNTNLTIDNVLVTVVPEPSSVALLGLASGLIGLRRRRSSRPMAPQTAI